MTTLQPASHVSYSGIHQLLLGDVAKDDFDDVFGLCDALGPHAKEESQVAFERQDAFEYLRPNTILMSRDA